MKVNLKGQLGGGLTPAYQPKVCPHRTVGNYAVANAAAALVVSAGVGLQMATIAAGQKIELLAVHLIHDEAANDQFYIYDGNLGTGTVLWRKDIVPQTSYNETLKLIPCVSVNGIWCDVETDWTDIGEKLIALDYRRWTERTV